MTDTERRASLELYLCRMRELIRRLQSDEAEERAAANRLCERCERAANFSDALMALPSDLFYSEAAR